MKVIREFNAKCSSKGRPFKMVELDDATVMKRIEFYLTEDGKTYKQDQKAKAKASVVAPVDVTVATVATVEPTTEVTPVTESV